MIWDPVPVKIHKATCNEGDEPHHGRPYQFPYHSQKVRKLDFPRHCQIDPEAIIGNHKKKDRHHIPDDDPFNGLLELIEPLLHSSKTLIEPAPYFFKHGGLPRFRLCSWSLSTSPFRSLYRCHRLSMLVSMPAWATRISLMSPVRSSRALVLLSMLLWSARFSIFWGRRISQHPNTARALITAFTKV